MRDLVCSLDYFCAQNAFRFVRHPTWLMLSRSAFYIFLVLVCVSAIAQHPTDYSQQRASGYSLGIIPGLQVLDNSLNFVVVGDWGRQGEYHQKEVALQMARAFTGIGGDFVVSTGDNFYPNGVVGVPGPLWQSSFESIYHYTYLQHDWYPVLGNHDDGGNPDAQIEYSKISRRWRMPARYYAVKKRISGSHKALFVFIDTNGFEPDYYKKEDLPPPLSQQDTLDQKQWFRQALADPDPTIRWRTVVGHHPLYIDGKRIQVTGPVRQALKPILDEFAVDLYLGGHEHDLQYNKPAGPTHHFLLGAGSELSNVPHKMPENGFYKGVNGFITFSI